MLGLIRLNCSVINQRGSIESFVHTMAKLEFIFHPIYRRIRGCVGQLLGVWSENLLGNLSVDGKIILSLMRKVEKMVWNLFDQDRFHCRAFMNMVMKCFVR